GRVIRRTFDEIRRNLSGFLLLSLLLVMAPNLTRAVGQAFQLEMLAPRPSVGTDSVADTLAVPMILLGWVAAFVGSAYLQGAIILSIVSDPQGRRRTLMESLRGSTPLVLPLIGLSILVTLASTIGLLLLVVPGLMLIVRWAVAMPTLVIEGRGVTGSMGRSAELTKDNRWRIFGAMVAYWALVVVAYLGFAGLGQALVGSLEMADGYATIVIDAVRGALLAIVATAGSASLYIELKEGLGGVGDESIAAVFD
ncbi:MAG TPA: YciC family protein, partial [Caulobacteraceae bacterium]